MKLTNKERTGYEFSMQNPISKQKMIESNIKKYGALFNPEKTKETCLNKWGVEIYASSADCKEKRENTLMKHYGVKVPLKNKEILDKQKQSMIEKYGYEHNFKNPQFIEKMKSKEMRDKQWETKKHNGTTNSSKIEQLFKQYLIDNDIKFEFEYNKDNRYPWHCDFYLIDYELFIEIQGSWTHGGHPYNPNNIYDIKLLNKWKSKAIEICESSGKKKSQYNSAIRVWTELDVKKRNTAYKNNLNYLEIFSCDIDECVKQLNNYLDKYNINNKN